MTEELVAQLATLTYRVDKIEGVPDRVLTLENDFRNMKTDITEVKNLQQQGIRERQAQYDSLTTQISSHHSKAMEKIGDTNDNINAIYSYMKAIAWLSGSLVIFIGLCVSIYVAWPK